MTDGATMLDMPSGEPPKRPNRAAIAAGATAGVVILATVGAVIGWNLGAPIPRAAAPGADAATSVPSTPDTPTRAESRPPVTWSPSRAAPTTASQTSDQQGLPDLVGMDFETARDELRARHLGWALIFASSGTDRTVESTVPPAGSPVRRGLTVRLTVSGAAPPTVIPQVVGLTCDRAAEKLGDNGLYPRYPMGRNGSVRKQDPDPSGTARWNDEVRLYCGPAVDPATGSPTP